MVFLTVPYFDSGVSGAGTPWPEDNPLRVEIDNAIMREVAAASGGNVYVFDLNAVVSPGGHYSPTVGSVNVRCGDGCTSRNPVGSSSAWSWHQNWLRWARRTRSCHLGVRWPGPLPPSTPPWFSDLPCQ